MTSRPTDPRLSRFERKRKDGTRYVYERETRYNPEKGYTETLRTSLLYKITASGDRIATNGVGRGMRPAAADAARPVSSPNVLRSASLIFPARAASAAAGRIPLPTPFVAIRSPDAVIL